MATPNEDSTYTSAHHLEFFRTVLYDTLSLALSLPPLSDGLDRLSYSTLSPADPSTVVVIAHTVPTKLLGTPPFFQCILMALRVFKKCNNS
jgi:hypothetical protein